MYAFELMAVKILIICWSPYFQEIFDGGHKLDSHSHNRVTDQAEMSCNFPLSVKVRVHVQRNQVLIAKW